MWGYGALGITLGVALAASPAAAAGPIEETWPYMVVGTPTTQILPGVPGPETNLQDINLWLADFTQADRTVSPFSDPSADWYTEHLSSGTIALLGSYTHEVVESVIDPSFGYPHPGTVLDSISLLPFYLPLVGPAAVFLSYNLTDPELGFASSTGTIFLTNTFLSDSAGVADFITFLGQVYPLFEIPFTPGGGAADDLGDGFQQLLTELSAVAPGMDVPTDLF